MDEMISDWLFPTDGCCPPDDSDNDDMEDDICLIRQSKDTY